MDIFMIIFTTVCFIFVFLLTLGETKHYKVYFKYILLPVCILLVLSFQMFESLRMEKKTLLTGLPISKYGSLSQVPPGCPNFPIASFHPSGRLGNKMSSYANFIMMQWIFGLQFYVPKNIKKHLEKVFKNVTFPTLESLNKIKCGIKLKKVDSFNKFLANELSCRSSNASIGCNNQSVIIRRMHWGPHWTLLQMAKERLLSSHFQFTDQIEAKVHKILMNISRPSSTVYVGVHVRRTDMISKRKKQKSALVNETYFEAAMEYFKAKLNEPVFIFTSDDLAWCKKHFSGNNIFHLGGNSGEVDLALLSSCNHTIIDYGSYGKWAAFLADGEVVVPRSHDWSTRHLSHPLGWTVLDGF